MYKFGKAVVKGRFAILIISLVLLVPSLIGMLGTRINYDILSYLPKELDTMKGQDIMLDEFGKGGFAFVMIDGMQDKDVKDLEKKFAKVDLPKKLYDFFNSGDSTLLAVFFDSSSASDESLKALNEVKSIAGKQCFVAGMTAAISDIKDLTLNETMGYVILAVCLTSLVLALTMDSFLIPVFFMLSVGMAILYNLGSNFFLGEISFITQALTAVLQLGVTIDYSIFLWHSYKEEQGNHPGDNKEAMAQAISKTISSVVGSSITTVAGFLALCFMSYKLGLDMGIVMAKGVVIGVIACVTVLPSMILIFDKALAKTMHRDLIPKLDKLSSFIIRHRAVCLTAFLVVLIPAVYGYTHTDVYYDLTATLPKDLDSIVASTKLEEQYQLVSKKQPIFGKPTSKNCHYQIDDCFFRFWFRFVFRYRGYIELERYEQLREMALRDFDVFSGYALERYFHWKFTETTTYGKMGAWWDRKGSEEIDLVCEDELGGEIAFYEVKRDPERYSEAKLTAKIERFFEKNPEKRKLRQKAGLLSLSDM